MNTSFEFWGYRRPDGSFGVRNHVLILGAMDNINPVVRRISEGVKGTVPLWAAYGRGMIAEDAIQHERTLVGYAVHPNVAAVLVISMEPQSAQRLAKQIAATGRPVQWLAVQQEGGTAKTVDQGIRLAMQMVIDAGRILREPVPAS